MRYFTIIAVLLIAVTGCNRSEQVDEAQIQARRDVRNLGASLQGKHMVTVRFTNKEIKGSDLAALTKLDNVNTLYLSDTNIGDDGMVHLQNIKGLQVLLLDGTNVTDAGMADIKKVSGLLQLTCSEHIGDEGLAQLKDCPNLNSLNMVNAQVTDDGLVHLLSLKKLVRLNLNGTSITDKGLEHIQAISKVHSLQLNSTRITDKGLLLLENLTNLTELAMEGTGVTQVGLARLRKALPDTDIAGGPSVSSPTGMGPPGGGAPGGGGGGRSFNPESMVTRVMESNDKDENGSLSAEEIEAINERFRDRIKSADADEDGVVTKEELLKSFTDRAAQRESDGGGGGRPGGGDRPAGSDSPSAPPTEQPPEGASAENSADPVAGKPAATPSTSVFGSLLRAVSSGTQKTLGIPPIVSSETSNQE
jgi:predicted transcriptional regulator